MVCVKRYTVVVVYLLHYKHCGTMDMHGFCENKVEFLHISLNL